MTASQPWSPKALLQLSGSYWSSCALHAAVKLDIFTPLVKKPLTVAQLAVCLQADLRGLLMLLNAITGLGLLTKKEDHYGITPFSDQYLVPDSADYLGHIIMHHHHLMDGWSRLSESVLSGKPARRSVSHTDDATIRESFLMGMYNIAMQQSRLIVPTIDLSGRRRLLDLGGGPGTYAVQFCLHNPELTATIFDLPTSETVARATIARFQINDRVDFYAGDYFVDAIPAGYDVAWLSQIVHSEGPQSCVTILKKAVDALEAGGLLLIQEFMLDDSGTAPLHAALFSLNMLIGTSHGQAYAETELRTIMTQAGLHDIQRLPLVLPNGAGILAGKK